MTRLRIGLLSVASVVTVVAAATTSNVLDARVQDPPDSVVHALFDLARPDSAPFPSDAFTVADETHMTGRRVNLPHPDCGTHPSDCEDVDVANTLDGFGLQPRVSIPFDGPIDPTTVTSDTVFLVGLGRTRATDGNQQRTVIGINQIVWDALTNTLHAEADELLEQHTRYALVVTNGIHDTAGGPVGVSEAFRRFRQTATKPYKQDLLEAMHAARALGVDEDAVLAASVFSTQSVTPVMERIRDDIKWGTPAAPDFLIGAGRERAVFARADIASIVWHQQTAANPPGFTTMNLDVASLSVVPGAIATVAYGTYDSPAYRTSDGHIPAVGTRDAVPLVQAYETIAFTLFLPAGPKPLTGWPVAIVGVPTARHPPMSALAATLASRGVATIGIHTAGCAFGPLSTLTITRTGGSSLVIPDKGRSHDQNGDNIIGPTEGSVAAAPRAWTIGERDSYRQTAIDLLQLVRVIEFGVDVEGDGSYDLDADRISHIGFSAGAMHGTMFLALEPEVTVAVENNAGGMVPEHARLSPVRRPVLGASLESRIPSLINAPGLTAVDGVGVAGPHFNENKPLRALAAVTNMATGAADIQRAFEMQEWVQQTGQSPIVWAPYIRASRLAGVPAKSFIYQFARGDQQANNPGTAALLRAGGFADRTLHYRHDLAFAESPTIPKNPHQVLISPLNPNLTYRAIARGMQLQIAEFIASGGATVLHPEPARFFELPVTGPPSEALNYIP